MSHVAARIERAWTRPRAPVDGGRVDCRALITQDRSGVVLDSQLHGVRRKPGVAEIPRVRHSPRIAAVGSAGAVAVHVDDLADVYRGSVRCRPDA
jgi:hypothetical protein